MNEAERMALRTSTKQLGSNCFWLTASSTAVAVLSEGDVRLSIALNAIRKIRTSMNIRMMMVLDFTRVCEAA